MHATVIWICLFAQSAVMEEKKIMKNNIWAIMFFCIAIYMSFPLISVICATTYVKRQESHRTDIKERSIICKINLPQNQ